jgi:transposase
VLQHAEEVSGNVAATCCYYGISRNVFYRWKRRYEDEGLEGLKDRSSAPLYCPTVTHPDIVEKIIHLRQHYHFGPMKIRIYLKRYHDVEISASGVWRILKRLGMNRLPASQRYKRHTGRWKRYEKQRPGHYVQIDVKFIEPITTGSGCRKRYYQYTAIDDCTRLRVLRTAIQFLDGVVEDDAGAGLFNQKLKEWEDYYNYHRPHGGLGGQTPYERLLQKTKTQPVTGPRQSHTARLTFKDRSWVLPAGRTSQLPSSAHNSECVTRVPSKRNSCAGRRRGSMVVSACTMTPPPEGIPSPVAAPASK